MPNITITPTPWRLDGVKVYAPSYSDTTPIVTTEFEADAEFIVRAPGQVADLESELAVVREELTRAQAQATSLQRRLTPRPRRAPSTARARIYRANDQETWLLDVYDSEERLVNTDDCSNWRNLLNEAFEKVTAIREIENTGNRLAYSWDEILGVYSDPD